MPQVEPLGAIEVSCGTYVISKIWFIKGLVKQQKLLNGYHLMLLSGVFSDYGVPGNGSRLHSYQYYVSKSFSKQVLRMNE